MNKIPFLAGSAFMPGPAAIYAIWHGHVVYGICATLVTRLAVVLLLHYRDVREEIPAASVVRCLKIALNRTFRKPRKHPECAVPSQFAELSLVTAHPPAIRA